MASYRLQDDLSFCRIDGRLIFLDIRNDRYFRLSTDLERIFVAHVEGTDGMADVAPLVERNILTAAPPSPSAARHPIENASLSALELPSPLTPNGRGAVVEALAIVCWTQIQLKTRSLKATLNSTVACRRRTGALDRCDIEPRLLKETLTFLKARKLVPVENRCLLDSLSLTAFLARRDLYASIVFGVTSDPFSAHCWVQSGKIVLNDTLGHTRAYTVVQVI